MKKTKKALASLAIAGMVLSMAPMSVFAADTTATNRIFGADRIETAVKVAQAGWTTAATVIVAPAGDANLVDALAAAPLAGQEKAPILLTDGAALDAKTKQAIVDLKATKVYAVGALSDQVVMDLQGISGVTVEALKGADRIETATKIVAKLSAPVGSFVVGYNALADALSVASFAAANNYSILVTNPDGTLPTSETAVGTKYTVGGPTLVADVAGATRLYGLDRFETNQKVLAALEYSYGKAYVANGEDAHLVDSLVGSSLAAQNRAAIVLGDTVSAKAAADVSAKLTSDSQVIALGGVSLVPDSVLASVNYQAPATLAVESVSAINSKQIEVKFSKAVDEDSVVASDDHVVTGLLVINRLPEAGGLKDIVADDLWASLSDDGTVLTLTADSSTYFDGTYALSIVADEILSSDRSQSIKGFTTSFKEDDTAAPTVTSVTYKPATSQLKVVMSEPVLVKPSVKVEGATVAATVDDSNVPDTFYVDVDPDLAGTTIDVVVSGAQDNLRNIMASYSKSITLTQEVGDVSLVSLTQKNTNTVAVQFNRAIDGVDADAAALIVENALTVQMGVTPESISVTRDSDDKTNTTFNVALTDGSGPDWFYGSDKDSASLTFYFDQGSLEDVYGNTNTEDISKTVRMVKSTVGPQIESYRVTNSEKEIRITFDQTMAEFTATSTNLLGIDLRKSGVSVGIVSAKVAEDSKELVLTVDAAASTAFDNGDYSVRFVKGATTYLADLSGNKVSTQTYSGIKVDDGDTSTVSVDSITSVADSNVFVVTFDGEVGLSALDPENYSLDGSALPTNTDVVFTDDTNKEVTITLQKGSVNYDSIDAILAVIGVIDADGNAVDVDTSGALQVADNTAAKLVSANLIGNTTMVLKFDENIDASSISYTTMANVLDDFIIKRGTTTLVDANTTPTDVAYAISGKTLTITVTDPGTGAAPAAGTNFWSTIAASGGTITVKTVDIPAMTDTQDVIIKDGVQVTFTRTSN